MKKINIAKIKPHTWVSLIMFILVCVNQVLTSLGKPIINLGEDQITYAVNTVMNIAFIAYGAWKNQSVTDNAQMADEILYALRDGRVTKEEIEGFIEDHQNPNVPRD